MPRQYRSGGPLFPDWLDELLYSHLSATDLSRLIVIPESQISSLVAEREEEIFKFVHGKIDVLMIFIDVAF